MDNFSVHLSGDLLRIDEIILLLEKLEVTQLARAGQTKMLSHGKERENPRGLAYDTSSLILDAKDLDLLYVLDLLLSKKIKTGEYGIDKILISALLERTGQINGEISEEEVKGIASLGAGFIWSVMFELQ